MNPFKGTLSAVQAGAAVARGLRRSARGFRVDVLAAADGGPGTLDAVRSARGGRLRRLRVPGPLGRPVEAAWLDLGTDALIESAQAIGLERVSPSRRDALASHSEGLAWLLLAAAKAGKRRAFVGLGGSACSDGGAGLARALGWRLEDAQGSDLAPGGGSLIQLARLRSPQRSRLGRMQVLALCDVDNPLHGVRGAAHVFSPQKSASPAQVLRLDLGLKRLARIVDPALARQPGAGAAGGLGFGLMAFTGARLLPGAATLLALGGLGPRLRQADLVITGEGCLDTQSLHGKLPAVVAAEARRLGKPCFALCGRIKLGSGALKKAGFRAAIAAPGKTSAQAARALVQAAAHFF
jgi:glycerate kinase